MHGRTQGKKILLGPKGFKTITKSKCQEACGHCLQMRALGEGNISCRSSVVLSGGAYTDCALKGKPSLFVFVFVFRDRVSLCSFWSLSWN